jgi:hypothetical protein
MRHVAAPAATPASHAYLVPGVLLALLLLCCSLMLAYHYGRPVSRRLLVGTGLLTGGLAGNALADEEQQRSGEVRTAKGTLAHD